MAAQGQRHHQVVEDVSVSVRTLQHWLNTYKERGLTGLSCCAVSPGRVGGGPGVLASGAPMPRPSRYCPYDLVSFAQL